MKVAPQLTRQLFGKWRRASAFALACAASIFFMVSFGDSVISFAGSGAMMKRDSPEAILHDLKNFREMGSALYIAAHPDDENTELLAYLSRGRNYRTAYMSLTRGDGGQNVLGPDLGAKLGIARTQELLAARRIDGAQQFFSRAVDFGFSKDYRETLTVWDKQEVLSDIVRVIREFRPDILITRFSPSPGGTHGHHTASAVLAMEAFKAAADPEAFPEQGLPPWQAKRIMWNTSIFQKDKVGNATTFKIDAGGRDPVSGETFNEIAGASRSMHKTQGFDTFKFPGADNPERIESFQLLDGAPITKDIMDDVDTTWHRINGGDAVEKSIDAAIANFDQLNPALSVPALLQLRKELAALPHSTNLQSVVDQKRQQLDGILKSCLGLDVQTTVSQADVVPGEPMTLRHTVALRGKLPDSVAISLTGVRYPLTKKDEAKVIDLRKTPTSAWDTVEVLPVGTALAQPWWLRSEGTPGMFKADDSKLIGTAENAPAFPVENNFDVNGQTLVLHDEPVQVSNTSLADRIGRRLDVIPPVSLRFVSDPLLLQPSGSKTVAITVTASRANISGDLQLEAPAEWQVAPKTQAFALAKAGEKKTFEFEITAPAQPASAKIGASAIINGVKYHNQSEAIHYAHIPPQIIQSPAVVHVVSFDLATAGHTIGYLPGAGDSLPENLEQMGYVVKTLDDATLTADQLKGLDAVVLGVRALNVRKSMSNAMPLLFDFVKNGGNVIVQYNRPDKYTTDKIAPYDLHISGSRVTDEKAAITLLAPENPLLNTPNKITSADFDGWVQERGLYFPGSWDDHFVPILACNDAGEQPLKGSLLVAQYGKGYYIYTGLGFFRQLPAGVPGAYRLFANMIAIGK